MNDNLQPLPDEHLEARITAWVLGEASPFEAAELEALCSSDPELQLFLNRTKALHSLLIETPPSSSDQFWKLSPENRAKLDPIIGSNNSTHSNKDSSIRRAAFRTAFGIAAVLTVTVFIKRFIFPTASFEKSSVTIVGGSEFKMELPRSRGMIIDSSEKVDFMPPGAAGGSGGLGKRSGDAGLVMSDREADEKMNERSSGGTLENQKKQKAFKSPQNKRVFAEASNEFKSIEISGTISRTDDTASPAAAAAAAPSAKKSEPLLSDVTKSGKGSATGYANAGGGRDMSNTAPVFDDLGAIRGNELASNESRQRSAFSRKGKELEQDSLKEKEDALLTPPESGKKFKSEIANTTVPGIPSETFAARALGNSPTSGLRSGDYAVQGESVDRILNNPSRSAPANQEVAQGLVSEAPVGRMVFSESDPTRTNPVITKGDDKDFDQRRLESGKVADTKSDYYRADYSNTRSELLMQVDKAWELSVPAEGVRNDDPFADGKPTVDPFAAKPAEFEGFINYGSPISGTATTSGALNIPVTPATPSNFESRLTESEEEALTILGDIPQIGRLFQPAPPSLTDLSEELSASQEVFSTFSLNISDASFQLASAAIAKGERPDPTSIKPEQFYNAVDYGDPAPSASEPVAAAIDQTAHPVIPGRNLVRVAVRTASAGRSAAQPLRLTLLVDQSGSMVRADRRAAMETALASLATLLTENDQVTVIGFSRTPHLLAKSLPGNEASKLPDLINQTASEGGTNLEQAINLATEQALDHQLEGAQNRIVLFTDGAANLGDADPERLSKKIQDLRQQGLAFDIAGIGTNDLNDRLLSDLARHGNGRYYLVGEKTGGNLAAQLAGAFRPAAENVKVQVKLNPQRVGNYKLIGFEKDRLKTEDFRNDTVDAAELAADEAGVALYQIETLPEGTGEIGEVSVRFRDTASGEMVERKWTIPYDASAPSFDKANPKTQLATLALLAAQKLQPGPLADTIDFSNYSETIAKLKQANANSSKTQQLLNLINALK